MSQHQYWFSVSIHIHSQYEIQGRNIHCNFVYNVTIFHFYNCIIKICKRQTVSGINCMAQFILYCLIIYNFSVHTHTRIFIVMKWIVLQCKRVWFCAMSVIIIIIQIIWLPENMTSYNVCTPTNKKENGELLNGRSILTLWTWRDTCTCVLSLHLKLANILLSKREKNYKSSYFWLIMWLCLF